MASAPESLVQLPERQGSAVRIAKDPRTSCVPNAAQSGFERRGERDFAFFAALGRPDDAERRGSAEDQEPVVKIQILPFESELLPCPCSRMEGKEKDRTLFSRAGDSQHSVRLFAREEIEMAFRDLHLRKARKVRQDFPFPRRHKDAT